MQQIKFLINIKYYYSVILALGLVVKFYQDTFYQTYTNNLLQKLYLLYSDEKCLSARVLASQNRT